MQVQEIAFFERMGNRGSPLLKTMVEYKDEYLLLLPVSISFLNWPITTPCSLRRERKHSTSSEERAPKAKAARLIGEQAKAAVRLLEKGELVSSFIRSSHQSGVKY